MPGRESIVCSFFRPEGADARRSGHRLYYLMGAEIQARDARREPPVTGRTYGHSVRPLTGEKSGPPRAERRRPPEERVMLTSEQVTQYRRDGYTLCPRFLGSDEVAGCLAEMKAICGGNTLARHDKSRLEMEPDQGPDGALVRRIYEPCTHYPRFRAFSESTKLLDCVEQLLGPDLVLHYSKINMKPPAIGSVVEWHQDLSYYPLTNPDSVSILFYLDDADIENGCLQVIPGGHLAPLLDHTRDGYFQGRVTEPVDEARAAPLEGKAGSVIFMHAMLPHASVTNRSRRPRRTLILSYRAADAFPIYAGEMTVSSEAHVRLVRGRQPQAARFALTTFPIPRYRQKTASLYELQELSRAGSAAAR
jgi:phytanoyl-CoA hydroxylase